VTDYPVLQAEPVITGQIFFRANSRTRGIVLPFVVAVTKKLTDAVDASAKINVKQIK